MTETTRTIARVADIRDLPVGVRACIWVEARHFFSRADAQAYCWLWLLRDNGCVHALRLDASWLGRDDRLESLLAHLDADPDLPFRDASPSGMAWPLGGAPVVPVPRWAVSWGHPLQLAIRAFAAHLDDEVLATLGRLEAPGPFFGSVANYNRLALLPQPLRRHRMQALDRFPPLVAPLLLDVFGRPDMFGTDEDEPRHGARCSSDEQVLDAVDRGRDSIGALATHYRIDRALVRSPLFREPWASGSVSSDVLRLLHSIPAHARPRRREEVETRVALINAIPLKLRTAQDRERLARAFKAGWSRTWQRLEADFRSLQYALRDTRDFLRSALEQAEPLAALAWLDMETLALAWIARRGLSSLLEASQRWHAQPLQPVQVVDDLPDELPPLFGSFEDGEGRAVELTSRQSLRDEGEAMHHCVGGYWDDCVLESIRIAHLQLPDGRTATAQYDCDGAAARVELVELRGPRNAECADDMWRFAQRIGAMLNSPAFQERCMQATRDAARARDAHLPSAPVARRALDRRSRDELRQVLAYCARQADWRELPRDVYRGAIAGFGYADGPHLLARMAVGDSLRLAREPDNPHDPLAVRVDWNDRKLGYVPRRDNAPIAHLLDAGVALNASIASLRHDGAWPPLECAIARRGQV